MKISDMDRKPDITQLASWLIFNAYAEEFSGYGHIGGYELAKVLLDSFEMIVKEKYFTK
jgi:hypothetical protein